MMATLKYWGTSYRTAGALLASCGMWAGQASAQAFEGIALFDPSLIPVGAAAPIDAAMPGQNQFGLIDRTFGSVEFVGQNTLYAVQNVTLVADGPLEEKLDELGAHRLGGFETFFGFNAIATGQNPLTSSVYYSSFINDNGILNNPLIGTAGAITGRPFALESESVPPLPFDALQLGQDELIFNSVGGFAQAAREVVTVNSAGSSSSFPIDTRLGGAFGNGAAVDADLLSLNNNGDVAFNYRGAIYSGSDRVVDTLVTHLDDGVTNFRFGRPEIDDHGGVVFYGEYPPNRSFNGLYYYLDGELEQFVANQDIGERYTVSDGGTVAYDVEGDILLWNSAGLSRTYVDFSRIDNDNELARDVEFRVNEFGQVAYAVNEEGSEDNLAIYTGPTNSHVRVVGVGDQLFGYEVTDIIDFDVSDRGDIGFSFEFLTEPDGTGRVGQGVAIYRAGGLQNSPVLPNRRVLIVNREGEVIIPDDDGFSCDPLDNDCNYRLPNGNTITFTSFPDNDADYILPLDFVLADPIIFDDVPAEAAWYDPPVVDGYVFQVSEGSPRFTQIADFPVGFSGEFTVSAEGQILGTFGPGDRVDFVELFGEGIESFLISGIDPGVDVEDPLGFPIKLAFEADGANFRMQGVNVVPEPSSAALFGLGGLALLRRRRR